MREGSDTPAESAGFHCHIRNIEGKESNNVLTPPPDHHGDMSLNVGDYTTPTMENQSCLHLKGHGYYKTLSVFSSETNQSFHSKDYTQLDSSTTSNDSGRQKKTLHHLESSYKSSSSSLNKSSVSFERTAISNFDKMKDYSCIQEKYRSYPQQGTSCDSVSPGYLSEYDKTRWTGLMPNQETNWAKNSVIDHGLSKNASPKSFNLSSTLSSSLPVSSVYLPSSLSLLSLNSPQKTVSPYFHSAIDSKSARPASVNTTNSKFDKSLEKPAFYEHKIDDREMELPDKTRPRSSTDDITDRSYINSGNVQSENEQYWQGLGLLDTKCRFQSHVLLSPRGSNGNICSIRSINADSAVDLLTPEEEGLDFPSPITESVDWFKSPDTAQYKFPSREPKSFGTTSTKSIQVPAVSDPSKDQELPGCTQNKLSQESGLDHLSLQRQNSNTSISSSESSLSWLSDVSDCEEVQPKRKLPKELSINYHDSPLPRYAGINATSWAIIYGENNHGISWHVVEKGIDTGDILEFKAVSIEDDESALTLNLKCQEAAKETFQIMLQKINQGKLVRQKQRNIGRSYYGLCAIPPNIGVLNFNISCKNICNLGRGLEFGKHDNSLGSPKVLTSTGDFVLITNVEETLTHSPTLKYGTIKEIFYDTLVVTTESTSVLLSIAKLDGSHLPPSEYRELGISVGERLSSSFEVNTQQLTEVRKKETFWKKKLHSYEPTTFFRQRMNVVARIIDVSTAINIKSIIIPVHFPDMNGHSFHTHKQDLLLSAFIAFISRVTCDSNVSLGLLADKSNLPQVSRQLYSDICPGVFTVDLHQNTLSVLDNIYDIVKMYRESQTFLVDIFYRYPELREQKRSPHHNIAIGTTPPDNSETAIAKHVLFDCNILVLFNVAGDEMHLLYKDKLGQDFDYITDVLKHFPPFLKSLNGIGLKKPLSELHLVPEDELKQLYPKHPIFLQPNQRIFDIFQEQCLSTPKNTALRSSTMSHTYEEFKYLVDSVSSLLRNTGKDERIIGLHLPNSIAYVTSVLGVLKTGRAFLPLPVDYPEDRLAFVMRDAKAQSVLTTLDQYEKMQSKQMTVTPIKSGMVRVDKHDVILIKFPFDENDNLHDGPKFPDRPLIEDGICYVMYTSGSTGKPKGVKVSEAGVINMARAQIQLWDLNSKDVIAQFASIGFDATISEIFTALFSGATLVTLNEQERLGQEFIRTMNVLDVNTITLAPSALNIYNPNDLPKLTKVVTAGEACSLGTALKWTVGNTQVRFFNAYGPTETTVCATCYEFNPSIGLDDDNQDMPIGKAIPGMCVYLFDNFMKPVPPEVVGEIYIGGTGLSKGYIGHAFHQNNERFVQNSMVEETCRLYKTGDHAFQSKTGNITYVGRLDDMIKIRGQRVDLSEIEQVLIQHTKIELAVVVVHKCNKSKEISIAAYVAPSFVYLSELREYLTKALPKYMIPTFIKKFEVADFPVTLNGKIDRKCLEKDESVHEQIQLGGSSHLNETQLAIAKLWCTVLKLDVSIIYNFHRQTSFSELGGNSLQLVLLQRTLEERLHIQLSFTDLGKADTIEEFSDVVKRKKDMLRSSAQHVSNDPSDLRQEIMEDSVLDPTLLPHHCRHGSVQFSHFSACSFKYPRNVLISGVTGFLGAYLLSELLEQTNAHVCCMVRESTEARGLGRIIENLRKYNLWKVEYPSRIAVVISDLSQENLGIAPDIYTALCNVIDVVFMNAAKMNFNNDYEDHKIANVDSTKEFIKFALTGTQKYIFTTSSLAVFLFPDKPPQSDTQRRLCFESEFFDDPCLLEGGYSKSKWASEKLVSQALEYLPGGAIFRPARISGSSKDGAGPKNDLFASTLLGMKRFGSFPDMDFPYDLTPVDYVAKAMVEISLKICNESGIHEKVYHLFNPQTVPFRDIFKGMGLKPLDLDEWRKELKNATEDNKELIPFTPFFLSGYWDRAPYWPIFDTTNTDKLISDNTKKLLKPSRELLEVYKSYFGINY